MHIEHSDARRRQCRVAINAYQNTNDIHPLILSCAQTGLQSYF
ncbi:hypothetical protein ACVWW1_008553 [Bradyrhizobium sp. JR3.5]